MTLATCAKDKDNQISYDEAQGRLLEGEHLLILFGTGWGMAPEIFDNVDAVLPPVGGGRSYNHLSVRSAVSIVLDRLLGI